ncbi:acyltransferase family protein [Alistipes sp.]|uniref:acyltransferase family protein n=1 Tax=Alistipes sp. TaxID=1872444 RepID=UPI003AF06317
MTFTRRQPLAPDTYDLLKTFAILLVVLGHVTIIYSPLSSFPQTDGNKWINLFTDGIYAFHMPLFFFISGCIYVLGRQRQKYATWPELLGKKFRRLMVPYFLVGIFLLIPTLMLLEITSLSFAQSVGHLLYGHQVKHLWFLIALFIQFLFIRAAEPLLVKIPALVGILTSIALAILLPLSKLDFFQLPMAIRYLPYFLLGYYAQREAWTQIRLRGGEIASTIAVAAAIFLLRPRLHLPISIYLLLDYLLAFLCICLALQIVSRMRMDTKKYWYRTVAQSSFGIYLLHPMIIYSLFFLKADRSIHPAIMIPAVFIIALIVSILGTRCLRKLNLPIVLGETQKKIVVLSANE